MAVAAKARSRGSMGSRGELVAPTGHYRLVGVDAIVGPDGDYLIGDYRSLEDAITEGRRQASTTNSVYLYDDKGRCVWQRWTP